MTLVCLSVKLKFKRILGFIESTSMIKIKWHSVKKLYFFLKSSFQKYELKMEELYTEYIVIVMIQKVVFQPLHFIEWLNSGYESDSLYSEIL